MRGRIVKGIGGLYYVHCGISERSADAENTLREQAPARQVLEKQALSRQVSEKQKSVGQVLEEQALARQVLEEQVSDEQVPEKQAPEMQVSEDKAPAGLVYECRAKGIFRKDNRRPLVGDEVELDVLDEGKKTGNITKLLPRRSELIRPAVANVDQALVIFAVAKPQPNFNLLDRFLVMMAQQGIGCVICFNKIDIDEDGNGEEYRRMYHACGYQTLGVSAVTGEGIDMLKSLLAGKVTAVAGPSGVGKSSLINRLQPDVVMETGEISAKIERGRHTTRHSELIALGEDAYILDTPGFSSLGIFDLDKGELAAYYPEFAKYEGACRFADCAHIGERLCGVKAAVEEGAVSRMRYESYCHLYQELDYIQSKRGSKVRKFKE